MKVVWLFCLFIFLLLFKSMVLAQDQLNELKLAELARVSLVYLDISFVDPVNSDNKCTETKQGSGFIVTTDGHVLTSYHLLATPTACRGFSEVRITGRIGYHLTGDLFPLRLTGRDSNTDVAVLKFFDREEKFDATPICISTDLAPSTKLMAFGFPLGTGFSPQQVNYSNPDGTKDRWVVTSNFVHGMSGGPVYDTAGRVVGIVQGGVPKNPVLNQVIPIRSAAPMIQMTGLPLRRCETISMEEVLVKQGALDLCVREKLAPLLSREFDTGRQGARCPGGGCFLESNSCNKRTETLIYNAASGFYIDSHRFNDLGSNGGATTGSERVDRDASGSITTLSINLMCDPADYIGAGGGWNYGSFTGKLRMTPVREASERASLEEACRAEQLAQ